MEMKNNNKDIMVCSFCNRKAIVMYYPEVLSEGKYAPLLSGLPVCRVHDRNALRCWKGATLFKD